MMLSSFLKRKSNLTEKKRLLYLSLAIGFSFYVFFSPSASEDFLGLTNIIRPHTYSWTAQPEQDWTVEKIDFDSLINSQHGPLIFDIRPQNHSSQTQIQSDFSGITYSTNYIESDTDTTYFNNKISQIEITLPTPIDLNTNFFLYAHGEFSGSKPGDLLSTGTCAANIFSLHTNQLYGDIPFYFVSGNTDLHPLAIERKTQNKEFKIIIMRAGTMAYTLFKSRIERYDISWNFDLSATNFQIGKGSCDNQFSGQIHHIILRAGGETSDMKQILDKWILDE